MLQKSCFEVVIEAADQLEEPLNDAKRVLQA